MGFYYDEPEDMEDDGEEMPEEYGRHEYQYHDEEDFLIDGVGFADPGGNSSLRAATPRNPRNLPCPTCGEPNRLTPLDVQAGYQCNACADRCERGGP